MDKLVQRVVQNKSGQGGVHLNPRKRKRDTSTEVQGPSEQAYLVENPSIPLNTQLKAAAQRVSPSVVGVYVSDGHKVLFRGSGIIINSGHTETGFFATVLTAAHVVPARASSKKKRVCKMSRPVLHTGPRSDVKIKVCLPDGDTVPGVLRSFDHHYNVAIVSIKSNEELKSASLSLLDDSLPILDMSSSVRSDLVSKISPGDRVAMIGRISRDRPFEAVVSPAEYSADSCKHDCKELLRLNGEFYEYFVGGPVVDSNCNVIGLLHCKNFITSFLPVNVVLRWLDFTKHGRPFHRLSFGMEFTNLYAARLGRLDRFVRFFPGVSEGVIIEEVAPKTPAYEVGLKRNQVIVKCDDEMVRGSLQFLEMIHEKVGKRVELTVLGADDGSTKTVGIVFEETTPRKINRWPLPKIKFIYL